MESTRARMRGQVIYQLILRNFTPEGTLSAAQALLPHLRRCGFTVVYLCPCFVHDPDEDREHWSARQKASGLDNPKNPYRMSDYYHVDPEYGSDADLRGFIAQAHRLGLLVMLDLVYLHCGPKAVFLPEHPDFVRTNPDGSICYGEWPFPLLNFDSRPLREYLWSNMEYYVREFDCDGFRCDVGDRVPLDFWREGIRRCRALKPALLMLNEGRNPEYLREAFDCGYCFNWSYLLYDVLRGRQPVSALRSLWEEDAARSPDGALLRALDNHDTATDAFAERVDAVCEHAAMDAAQVLNFTMDGVPFVYCGNEVADGHRHSLFYNRFCRGAWVIDWQNALTDVGQARLSLMRTLCALRRSTPELTEGRVLWADCGRGVLAYWRVTDAGRVFAAVNLTGAPVSVPLPAGTPLLSRGILPDGLDGYGYTVIREN